MMTYDDPKLLVKNYVSNITTQSQEGAYLAGILAAKTTKQHKLGIVISASDPNWYKMSGGFAAGVRSVDKASKMYFVTISKYGYDDAAGGKRVASSVINQGADVLMTMGDGATFGYLRRSRPQKIGHKVWMIGDIGDLTPIDKKHVFLSSVLWTFTNAYAAAIKDINAGTYGTHGYNLSLKNGGVSLLKTKYISGLRVEGDRWRRPASSAARSRSRTARPRAASTSSSGSALRRRASAVARPPRAPAL